MTAIAPTLPSTQRLPGPGRLAAVAGGTYVGAWLVGLAVRPGGLALDAVPSEVVAHYAAHGAAAATQSLLTHGVAGATLGRVALAVAGRGRGRARRVAVVAGLGAAVLSLVQAGLGLVAAADSDSAPAVVDVLNRVDGVKMVGLAVFAAAGVAIARQGGLPRWLGATGLALSISLLPAAAAYLTLSAGLAPAAGPALVLLLVFVGGAGVAVRR